MADDHNDNNGPNFGISNVLKSLARGFKLSQVSVPAGRIKPTVVGGDSELQNLLTKVSSESSSTSDKIKAAELIRSILESSTISSIPEIWYAAENLVDSTQPECRRAGLRLLNSCINHDEDSVSSQVMYFTKLIKLRYIADFDLQLVALRSLTDNGRSLYNLYQIGYSVPKVLISWTKILIHEVHEIRAGKRKDVAAVWGVSMGDNLHDLLKYIHDTLMFSISVYNGKSLESLLREIVKICRITAVEEDVRYCSNIIDVIMQQGALPVGSLSPVTGILCGIYFALPALRENAWASFTTLCSSHLGSSTVSTLCDILRGQSRGDINSNTLCGAVIVLAELERSNGSENGGDIMDIPVSSVFLAYKDALNVESVRLQYEISSAMYQFFGTPEIIREVGFEVWDSQEYSPFEVIKKLCSSEQMKKLAETNFAKSSAVVGKISLSNDSDEKQRIPHKALQMEIFSNIKSILSSIQRLPETDYFHGPHEVLYKFLMDSSLFIDSETALNVLEFYDSVQFFNPLDLDWSEHIVKILNTFYYDTRWPPKVRLKAFQKLRDNYLASSLAANERISARYLDSCFLRIGKESSSVVMRACMDWFVEVCTTCEEELFLRLCDKMMELIQTNRTSKNSGALSLLNPFDQKDYAGDEHSIMRSRAVTRAMVRLFLDTFQRLPQRARSVYLNLVSIAQRSISIAPVFVEAARLLVRLRSTTSNCIMIANATNIDQLASTIGRGEGNVRPDDTCWWYPEDSYDMKHFDQKIMNTPSVVLTKLDAVNSENDDQAITCLDIDLWLNIVVNILESGATWEVYSFVLAHFPAQLSNLQLFSSSHGTILRLRGIITEHISSGKIPASITVPADISRQQAVVAEIRMISSLIAYKDAFSGQQADQLVQALVSALSAGEKAAVPSITALQVCCYELPSSIKKSIGVIFTKFQMKMTSTQSSPHILEFLLSLVRLTRLTDSMTQEEYKRIFAMAFTYIQHAHDMSKKAGASQDGSTLPQLLSQYLLALAYNIICVWFLALPLPNRRPLSTFITRNIILVDTENDAIGEQGMAVLDLVSRFTYADVELRQSPVIPKRVEARQIRKRWIFGRSLISLETDTLTGDTQFIVRRPTGTSIINMAPDSNMLTKRQSDLIIAAEADKTDQEKIFSPNYFLLQLVIPNDDHYYLKPIALENDAIVDRAVATLDRAPVNDFHKVGVLYIGPNQSTEQEILANQSGSQAYQKFLNDLGNLLKLKGNKRVYTGGLDTERDIDGEFTYFWNDKITQVIYHITTLMPPPSNPDDTAYSNKKRHIGNDYICIFFDESGKNFDVNVIRTQFSFISIVITPDSFQDGPSPINESATCLESSQVTTEKTKFYKVRAYAREGIPDVFAAMSLRLISENNVAVFVRNLAVSASKLATIYSSDGQYLSNWRYRLQQINRLRDRAMVNLTEQTASLKSGTVDNKSEVSGVDSKISRADIESSFLGQLAAASNSSTVATAHSSPSTNETSSVGNLVDTNDIPLLKSIDFSSFT